MADVSSDQRTAIVAGRTAYAEAIRAVLRARRFKCDGPCLGWFVDHETGLAARCDECALENGYAEELTDFDLYALDEVCKSVYDFRKYNDDER